MCPVPRGIAPYFLVENVVRAAEHYRDKLGFVIGPYFLDPPVFVILERDGNSIQLSRMEDGRGGPNRQWKAEAYDAYIWVDDVEALYHELHARGADLSGPPELKSYGMKEIDVRDLDGYVIRWGQDIPNSG